MGADQGAGQQPVDNSAADAGVPAAGSTWTEPTTTPSADSGAVPPAAGEGPTGTEAGMGAGPDMSAGVGVAPEAGVGTTPTETGGAAMGAGSEAGLGEETPVVPPAPTAEEGGATTPPTEGAATPPEGQDASGGSDAPKNW